MHRSTASSPEQLLSPCPLLPGQQIEIMRSRIGWVTFQLLTGITLVEAHHSPGTTLGDVTRGAIRRYIELGDKTNENGILDLNERLARTGIAFIIQLPHDMADAMTKKAQQTRRPVTDPLPSILGNYCAAWREKPGQEQRIIAAYEAARMLL